MSLTYALNSDKSSLFNLKFEHKFQVKTFEKKEALDSFTLIRNKAPNAVAEIELVTNTIPISNSAWNLNFILGHRNCYISIC